MVIVKFLKSETLLNLVFDNSTLQETYSNFEFANERGSETSTRPRENSVYSVFWLLLSSLEILHSSCQCH
jgi:hypothetical protein